MQKIDASVTPIQWPVSLGVAPKAEDPLSHHNATFGSSIGPASANAQ